MAKNKDYVSVPRDEYEELIECKTKVNLFIDYIFELQKNCIAITGLSATSYDASDVNNILGPGYINREIERYTKAYKQKIGEKVKCE